jgi:hypothetical protein
VRKLEDLIDEAKQLPVSERRHLLQEVANSLQPDSTHSKASGRTTYAALLEVAGTGTSDFTDVSIDKYKHLGHVYARTDKR